MKKTHKPTVAQILFKDHNVLAARPEGMTFQEYKVLQYTQKLVLNKMFRHCPDKQLTGIILGHQMYRTKRLHSVKQ